MYGDQPQTRTASTEPVPPARAALTSGIAAPAPDLDLPMIAPVRSGLFGTPLPPPPAIAAWTAEEEVAGTVPAATEAEWAEAIIEEEVTLVPGEPDWAGSDEEPETVTLVPDLQEWTAADASEQPQPELTLYGDEESTPWSRAAAGEGEEEEEEEIVVVAPAEPVAGEPEVLLTTSLAAAEEEIDLVLEPSFEAADEEGEVILETSFDMTQEEILLEPASPAEERSLHATAPPLSPWDLGAAIPAAAGGEERAARARQEWEAFGKALSQSFAGGGREIELTDEMAARLEAAGAWDHTPEALFGATPPERPTPRPQVPGGLTDLAARLEAFAEKLRAEGTDALIRAQGAGDRVDAMLAAIAAGFLAGRGE